tara:strand:- start:1803 stop:2216 length:414 start_codon:yes stop_codon:yes gene_type:complete
MKAKKPTTHIDRLNYYLKVSDVTIDKLQVQKNDLITYCLEELEGCERLYGLMFIFTQMDENDNVEVEDRDLIRKCTTLIIGDMINQPQDFVNEMVETIVDEFYTFDRLKEGYLVTHNFIEMEKYLNMRINASKVTNN